MNNLQKIWKVAQYRVSKEGLVFALWAWGDTEMRRLFFWNCTAAVLGVSVLAGAIFVLHQTQPAVAPPTLVHFAAFEKLFEKPIEGEERESISPRTVPTIRIFDPLEPLQ